MGEDKNCKHDFQAYLLCEYCDAKYDIAMVEIINQAKVDAVNKIVKDIQISFKELKNIDNAIRESVDSFETDLRNNNAEIMFLGTNNKL